MKNFISILVLLIGSFLVGACAGKSTAKKGKELDPKQVRLTIRTHMGDVQKCYAEGLKTNPKLAGKLVMHFEIDKQGTATNLAAVKEASTLHDDTVVSCIRTSIATWKFPIPPGNTVAEIRYPFVFKPQDVIAPNKAQMQ